MVVRLFSYGSFYKVQTKQLFQWQCSIEGGQVNQIFYFVPLEGYEKMLFLYNFITLYSENIARDNFSNDQLHVVGNLCCFLLLECKMLDPGLKSKLCLDQVDFQHMKGSFFLIIFHIIVG